MDAPETDITAGEGDTRTDGAASPDAQTAPELVPMHLIQLPSLSLRVYHLITAFLIFLELRRFNRHYRHNTLRFRLNPLREATGDTAWNTLDSKHLPTFVLQTA
ncbi:MAG: hypothetical protein AAGA94_18515, partial [Pseudomonadota bacterium]